MPPRTRRARSGRPWLLLLRIEPLCLNDAGRNRTRNSNSFAGVPRHHPEHENGHRSSCALPGHPSNTRPLQNPCRHPAGTTHQCAFRAERPQEVESACAQKAFLPSPNPPPSTPAPPSLPRKHSPRPKPCAARSPVNTACRRPSRTLPVSTPTRYQARQRTPPSALRGGCENGSLCIVSRSVSCKIFLVVTAPPRRSSADDSGAFFCPPFRPQTTPFPPQPLALRPPSPAG